MTTTRHYPSMAAVLAVAVCGGLAAPRATAQGRSDPATLLAAQRGAMRPLARFEGIWRGSAWTLLSSGDRHLMTQTERVGPFLDDTVQVIEGRSYEADGRVGFNAFATISYDVDAKAYRFHSHAQGRAGDFALTPTATGYIWEIPAGPQVTIRYTATVQDGAWDEVGDRVVGDQPPMRIFEMHLKRVGDTTWPAGDPVPAR